MALDDCSHVHACLFLQVIDILCHAAPKQALILQHLDEVVRRGGVVRRQIEVLSEAIESLGLLLKEAKFKDSLWLRQVVLLELRVEASTRRPEIWDASRDRDACSGHNQDLLESTFLQPTDKVLVREIPRLTHVQVGHLLDELVCRRISLTAASICIFVLLFFLFLLCFFFVLRLCSWLIVVFFIITLFVFLTNDWLVL